MNVLYRAALAAILLGGLTLGFAQDNKKGKAVNTNSNTRIFNPTGMHTPVGYSHVAEVTSGKIVYIAGQVAMDAAGNLVGKDDFAAQVEQVFVNLKTAVEAAGGTFKDVVKLNTYVPDSVDPALITAFRAARDKHVNTANPPASTFVIVRRLVRPEWLVEVEAVAVVSK